MEVKINKGVSCVTKKEQKRVSYIYAKLIITDKVDIKVHINVIHVLHI